MIYRVVEALVAVLQAFCVGYFVGIVLALKGLNRKRHRAKVISPGVLRVLKKTQLNNK